MEIGSSSLYLIAVLIAYFIFVFISERLNPFVKPKFYASSLSRWRFARKIALACLLFAWAGLFCAELFQIPKIISVGISILVFGIYWAKKGIERIKKRQRMFLIPETLKTEIDPKDQINTLYAAVEPSSEQLCVQEQQIPAKSENINRNNLEEPAFKLTMAHVLPNLTDLDQSFVEAKIESKSGNAGSNSNSERAPTISKNNETFGLATMDRKKRRLTIVKAGKENIRLRRNKQLDQVNPAPPTSHATPTSNSQ